MKCTAHRLSPIRLEMTTAPSPPNSITLLSLEMDLHHAERYLHMSDLLFQPPRSNAVILHEYQEGIFRLFSQAAYTAALAALRRCLDSSEDSTGLRYLARVGKIKSLNLSPHLVAKISAFLDQRLMHSDPRAANAQWWAKNESTRGELRTLLAETRTAIEQVTITHGARPARPADFTDIDSGMDRLIEDLHAAALLRQLRDRVKSKLPISAEEICSSYRPVHSHENDPAQRGR
jgi:hypothetical protein